LKNADTPYAKTLTKEAELLAKQGDHYLRHDHLEDENKQYYFNEFMAEAGKNGMQYLSDCSLSSMYLGNMGKEIAEKLKDLNDIVRTEQYMDFITNRRFRSTLLCHKGVKLNRALNNNDAKKFALSFNITPEKSLKDIKLASKDPLKFYFKGNKEQYITTSSPWLKAILYTFIENGGYPLKFDTIIEKANKKFKTDSKAQIEADLLKNVMNLVIKGYIDISLIERTSDKVKVDKPKISDLAFYQANNTNNTWVTNLYHAPVGINLFDKFALKYMDGKNTKQQILELLIKDVKDGKINMSKDKKKIEDPAQIKKELIAHLGHTVNRLTTQGLFV